MAEWLVSRQEIKIFEHTNADSLEIGDVGGYQVVIKKGQYREGDIVVFIPEKSLLPDTPMFESFKPYLTGTDKNRVKSVKMRGELSQGILLPDSEEFQKYEIGQDFAQDLGITKYEPFTPAELRGNSKSDMRLGVNKNNLPYAISQHDCEHFSSYHKELQPGEEVIVTEKVHGSQINVIRTVEGGRYVSSKGLTKRGLYIEETETNSYWRGVKNTNLFHLIDEHYPARFSDNLEEGCLVQVFGELVPVQKGYPYGHQEPSVLIFDIRIDGKSVPYAEVPSAFKQLWVPVIYQGAYDVNVMRELAVGKEQVSGKELHIREGVVVRPALDRYTRRGHTRLMLKVINPAYKETGEELA